MIHSYNKDPDKLKDAIEKIDQFVQIAAKQALSLDYKSADAHVLSWQGAAREYLDDPVHYNKAFLLYTNYGYAVERITYGFIMTQGIPLPKEYKYNFEVPRGMTRPDIILLDPDDKDIAWLDITSDHSREHIFSKDGGAWKTSPVVCEITYPPLDINKIQRTGDMSDRDLRYQQLQLRRVNYNIKQTEMKFLKAVERVYLDLISVRCSPVDFRYEISRMIRRRFYYRLPRDLGHDVLHSILQRLAEVDGEKLSVKMANLGYGRRIPKYNKSLYKALIRRLSGI